MNLLETLIAVTITAIVFQVASVAMLPSIETARISATQIELENLRQGELLFMIRTGRQPADFRELCRANLMARCDENDPFGNAYRMRGGEIISAGADGRFGTRDDIAAD